MNGGRTDLSGISFDEKPPGLVVHFTDGSIATVADLPEKMKGRGLEQIAKVELYPTGGSRLDGERDGAKVRGQAFDIQELPFPVMVVMPLEIAQQVGQGLAQPVSGVWTPP